MACLTREDLAGCGCGCTPYFPCPLPATNLTLSYFGTYDGTTYVNGTQPLSLTVSGGSCSWNSGCFAVGNQHYTFQIRHDVATGCSYYTWTAFGTLPCTTIQSQCGAAVNAAGGNAGCNPPIQWTYSAANSSCSPLSIWINAGGLCGQQAGGHLLITL